MGIRSPISNNVIPRSGLCKCKNRSAKIITGNFNQIILGTLAELNIVLANARCVLTFRARGLSLIVDLKYLSILLAIGMACLLNEHYTHGNHQAIFLYMRNGGGDSVTPNRSKKTRIAGWFIEAFE